jgi:hypothetical protein
MMRRKRVLWELSHNLTYVVHAPILENAGRGTWTDIYFEYTLDKGCQATMQESLESVNHVNRNVVGGQCCEASGYSVIKAGDVGAATKFSEIECFGGCRRT